jgi:hypothetical protein
MDMNKAFPKKYLSANDVTGEGDLVLTISDVAMELLGQGDEADTKPVVYFQEAEKGLVLNKTNAGTITGLYGPETDDWAGKRIALFATEVEYQGRMTLALRVRKRPPGGRAPQAPRPPAQAGRPPAEFAEDAWPAGRE